MPEDTISIPEVADSGMVLDQETNEWNKSYQRCFRRQRIFKLLDNFELNGGGGTLYTPVSYVAPYAQFALFAKQTLITGSLFTLNITPQSSLNGSDWYFFNDSGGAAFTWVQNDAETYRVWPLRDYTPVVYYRFRIVTAGGVNNRSYFDMFLLADSDAPQ